MPKKKLIVITVIAVFLVGFIAVATSGETKDSIDGASEQRVDSLANRVEKQFVKSWGADSLGDLRLKEDMPSDSLVPYISGFEDVSSGTVRVLVQSDIDKSEAERLGRNVITMTGFDIEDLSVVVVRGIAGLEVNRIDPIGTRQKLNRDIRAVRPRGDDHGRGT